MRLGGDYVRLTLIYYKRKSDGMSRARFLTQATGVTIPYIPFIIFAFTMLSSSMVILFLAGKILFRLDASKFILPEDVIAELEGKKSTKGQRVTFLILILYIMALLLPGLIPAFPGMQFLSTLGIVGMSSIALLVMNVIVIDGKPLINLANVFTKHVQWPLILLLAVTFPLASAMQADTSGIMVIRIAKNQNNKFPKGIPTIDNNKIVITR